MLNLLQPDRPRPPKKRNLIRTIVILLFTLPACAAEFNCEIGYAGTQTKLKVTSSNDPYQFSTLEPGGNFRFSAQHLADTGKLKTYVYHDSKDRLVLIHEAEYLTDTTSCTPTRFGLNRVYSPGLERELTFSCELRCPESKDTK